MVHLKLLKKLLSSVIAGTLLAGLGAAYIPNPSVVYAAEESISYIWNGEADTSWYEEGVTSFDISTPEQFAGLSQLVAEGNAMSGVTINLISDIVLNDTSNFDSWEEEPPANRFTPIGNENKTLPFCGLFNGNGHTISGAYAVEDNAAGLFGYLYCGGVARVIMKDCFFQANFVGDNVYAGGVAAIADGGIISECEFDGRVIAVAPRDMSMGMDTTYIGGICGACMYSSANLAPALAWLVFAGAGVFVNPAIMGEVGGGMLKSSFIVDCVNYGSLYLQDAAFECYFGGIVGYGHMGKIINSMHLGNMGAYYYSESGFTAGGVAGMIMNATMENCYYQSKSLPGVGYFEPSLLGDGIDNSVRTTKDELLAKDAAGLEEMLGEAFVNVNGGIHLKSDRSCWETLYGNTFDINLDGVFSVADVVALQKYLLASSEEALANWHAADLYEDGMLDVFDLALLRNRLISG